MICHVAFAQSPPDSILRNWIQGFRVHFYSDTARSNAYVDSIKTQLLDQTDTALYWEAQYLGLSAYIDARTGQFDNILPKLTRARKLLLSTGSEQEIQTMNSRIGTAYITAKAYDSALFYVQLALEGNQKLGNEPRVNRILGDLFIIYFYKGEYPQALQYIQAHVQKSIALSDTTILPQAYTNLAATYFRLEEIDSSYKYHMKSLFWANFRGSPIDLGYCYLNLGEIHGSMENLDSALHYHQKAQEAFSSVDFITGLTSNSLNLGKLYLKTGNINKALTYTKKSSTMAEEIGDLALLRDALEVEVNLHKMREDYLSALAASEQAAIIQDSLDTQLNQQQMDELITKYETQEKQQQINLQAAKLAKQQKSLQLNRVLLMASVIVLFMIILLGLLIKNRIRRKQEAQLQQERLKAREAEIKAAVASQESERTRYARDLHDGFGQMIAVLNMNIKNLNSKAKPDERQAIFESSEKILGEMYDELKSICFDLMPHTLAKQGLTAALDELRARINKTGNLFIETNYFGMEKRLSNIQEISHYRIIQEWVSNMLKHSDATKVTLQITKDDNEITLLIEDNGEGIDQQKLKNSDGNGWKNLQVRTNLIQGKLEIESTLKTKGNTLILNSPAKMIDQPEPQNTVFRV